MPLNHVCIWSEFEKCWKPITVEEAKKCSPNGTISAKSQQFLCSRCGQFVLLTREKKRERYFKHSSEEESKSCPDRSNYNSYSFEYFDELRSFLQFHALPLFHRL